MITSDQIRAELKQWDTFFNRVSKTQSLLDREFSLIDDLENYVLLGMQSLSDFFGVKDIQALYNGASADCENFALWLVAEIQKLWRRDNKHKLEPAVFRCIVQGPEGPHAIVMAFTSNGIFFCEPQTGQVFAMGEHNPKIIAVV